MMVDITDVLWINVGTAIVLMLTQLVFSLSLKQEIEAEARLNTFREQLMWDRIKEIEYRVRRTPNG